MRDLFLLRPDVTFLNHGSYGACPRPVFERYQAWQRELEQQPVEFLGRRYDTLLATARATLAEYVGTAANNLVYVPNATQGLNIVARSLDLQPNDEILTTAHEYGALDRTWQFICQKRGAHYRPQTIPLPVHDPHEVVEAIWAGVTPQTKVLFLSHITSPTALILPIAPLIARARAANILTVIDGAHAPGQIPLNLDELQADFYVGNTHKWLLSPKGGAFLYARPERQDLLEPLVVSWGWHSETPSSSRFIDEQEYKGTQDISVYLSVPAAIEFVSHYYTPEARQHCSELLRYARQTIGALTGLPAISPDSPTWQGHMVTLPLPPCHPHDLKRRLYDEFRVEIPVISWAGREFIRVSSQIYNTQADIDTLVTALHALLPQVSR